MKDHIVEEIRKVRDAYAAKFNHDVKAMHADMKQLQAKSGRKLVSFDTGGERQA